MQGSQESKTVAGLDLIFLQQVTGNPTFTESRCFAAGLVVKDSAAVLSSSCRRLT